MSGSRQPILTRRRAVRSEASASRSETSVKPADDPVPPRFPERAKLRRRLRHLRTLREVQLRDLGGLVLDLYKFRETRNDLLLPRLEEVRTTDRELRELEAVLDDRRPLRELREPGIGGKCPKCDAYVGTSASFCSRCGAPAPSAP